MWRSPRFGWACWDREQLQREVAGFLESRRLPNVVLDPVIRASSGAALLDEAGVEVLRRKLIPLCDVVTPNIDEAAVLVGAESIAAGTSWNLALPSLREMAAGLHKLGAKAVVITGGHLQSADDYLSCRVASGESQEGCSSVGASGRTRLAEPAAPSPQRSHELAQEDQLLPEAVHLA